jgi:hypothetical protein
MFGSCWPFGLPGGLSAKSFARSDPILTPIGPAFSFWALPRATPGRRLGLGGLPGVARVRRLGACHALTALRRGRGEAPRRGGGPSREFQTLLQHYDPQRPSVHNLSCVSKLVMRSEGRGERRKTKPSASISRIATPPNFALRETCSIVDRKPSFRQRSVQPQLLTL